MKNRSIERDLHLLDRWSSMNPLQMLAKCEA